MFCYNYNQPKKTDIKKIKKKHKSKKKNKTKAKNKQTKNKIKHHSDFSISLRLFNDTNIKNNFLC